MLIRLQVRDDVDEINWLECHLGERNASGRLEERFRDADKLFYVLTENAPSMQWYYNVTFGMRRE